MTTAAEDAMSTGTQRSLRNGDWVRVGGLKSEALHFLNGCVGRIDMESEFEVDTKTVSSKVHSKGASKADSKESKVDSKDASKESKSDADRRYTVVCAIHTKADADGGPGETFFRKSLKSANLTLVQEGEDQEVDQKADQKVDAQKNSWKFEDGQWVEIRGLESAAGKKLNGKFGQVMGNFESDADSAANFRISVCLGFLRPASAKEVRKLSV